MCGDSGSDERASGKVGPGRIEELLFQGVKYELHCLQFNTGAEAVKRAIVKLDKGEQAT